MTAIPINAPIMPRFTGLCDIAALEAGLASGVDPLPVLQAALHSGNAQLHDWYREGISPEQIVFGRTWLVDQLLDAAWRHVLGASSATRALVAVGGYGRGELHPHSDIDLLILLSDTEQTEPAGEIEALLTLFWDMGLTVAHSVRTTRQCFEEAEKDLTVMTNLMEARWLAGSRALLDDMRTRTGPDVIWSSGDFFTAKLQEQAVRHHKFHDTAYKLEPNVKESPGGLRDIQTITWVTQRHFGTDSLEALVERRFLTEWEYKALMHGRSLLWRVRNILHFLTDRREDRLLFDYQLAVAQQCGFTEDRPEKSVERVMKEYYRTVMDLNRLNEMLLQLFQEAILYADQPSSVVPINPRFQARNDYLEVTDAAVFKNSPQALLELFLLLEIHPQLKGVRAETIRLIRSHLYLIDDEFRNSPTSRGLFMEILGQQRGVTHALQKMNQYGVLAAYLPVFGNIVGQMQHDLIHVYTVDEHTLFLVRNLRRFTVPEYAEEYPLCSELMATVSKPALLYIAGLFHDIAKGRGGNHSELGAQDVEEFCLQHGLSEYDTHLVMWLVHDHLLMSTTAQRRDISDPDVVRNFAREVGSLERLNALYLLTVADIRATNPELWNSWKDALLITLYNETKRALRRGLDTPFDTEQHIHDVQESACKELSARGIEEAKIETLWRGFSDEYFLRCSPHEVAWHTAAITSEPRLRDMLVAIRQDETRGGTSILIYSCAQNGEKNTFAITTAILDQMGLTTVDAQIINFHNDCSLHTYLVLDETGEPIGNQYRVEEIRRTLKRALQEPGPTPVRVSRRAPRQFKHFPIPTQIAFSEDTPNHRTIVEVIATDRPGLLFEVARAFSHCGVCLQNAKVGTFGSRAEDVFYITDKGNRPLRDEHQFECLRQALLQNLGGGPE